jgi:hypothetical protein
MRGTNLKGEWISVEDHREVDSNNYEQVSDPGDPARGSSIAPIVNRNSSLSGYVPGAHGFDAPAGWSL